MPNGSPTGPDSTPEEVRLALRWHTRDRQYAEAGNVHEELEAAARELGVPPGYLERARAHLAERRYARLRWLRRMRGLVVFALGAGTGVVGTLAFAPHPAPAVAAPAAVSAVTEGYIFAAGPDALGYIDIGNGRYIEVAPPFSPFVHGRPTRHVLIR